jgi:hypothetical protein
VNSNDQSSTEKKQIVPIWKRLNKKGLTPLALAAQLGQLPMFSFLLDERKITQWCYGPVSCVLYPLDQLDLEFEIEVDFYLKIISFSHLFRTKKHQSVLSN